MDTFEFLYEGGKIEAESPNPDNLSAHPVIHETSQEEYRAFLAEIQRLNFVRYQLPKIIARWGLITLTSFSLGTSLIQNAPETEPVPVWNIQIQDTLNNEVHMMPLAFDENGELISTPISNPQNSFMYGE